MGNMNEPLRELGRTIAEYTERGPQTEETLRSVGSRLRSTAYTEARSTFGRGLGWSLGSAATGLALACAVGAAVVWWPQPQRPLSVELESREGSLIGKWVEANSETKQLRFSDGTQVALSPDTKLQVQATTQRGGTVVLEHGRALAQIVPEPKARWLFIAGPFQVKVTGTAFDLGWDPAQQTLELALHHGSVELSGPTLSEPRRMTKGEFVRVQLTPTASGEPQHRAPTRTKEISQAPVPPTSQEPQTTDHRDTISSQMSSDELWRLSQSARLNGRPNVARDALLALRQHHGTRGETAFLLGKIHADQLGSKAEAIRWFGTYLKEAPSGTLREQALGRLVELQAGTEAGQRAAREYLARYPGGSYAKLARRSL